MFPVADTGVVEFPSVDAAVDVFPGSVSDFAEFPTPPTLVMVTLVDVVGEGVPGAVVGAIPVYPVAVIGSGVASGTSTPIVSTTVAASGSGLAKLVYGEIIAVDVTGSGSAGATVVPVVNPVVAVSGSGTGAATIVPVVNPAGGVSAAGTAAATVVPVGVGALAVSGSGAAGATVVGVPSFQPSGMTKSGTQSFTTSWAKLLGWTADTGNYPGSTVVDNSLDVQGAKPNATITVSLPYTGSFTNPHTARILVNGVVVATGAAVSTQSGTMTATATSVALMDTDKVSVEVMVGTYANGSVSDGGYVRIT